MSDIRALCSALPMTELHTLPAPYTVRAATDADLDGVIRLMDDADAALGLDPDPASRPRRGLDAREGSIAATQASEGSRRVDRVEDSTLFPR